MNREQRAKVVLRLTDEERETFQLLNSALKVSEYTNEVDGMGYGRERRIKTAMVDLFTTIIGLSHVAETLPKEVVAKFAENKYSMKDVEPTLASAFEIARRYKRINPDKMRSEYGKLTMMLQDLHCSRSHGFDFKAIVVPVKTVGGALEAIGASRLLDDERLSTAAMPLPSRATEDLVAQKAAARAALLDEFGSGSSEDRAPSSSTGDDSSTPATPSQRGPSPTKRDIVERCIKSLDDAATFVDINTRPLKKLLRWLDGFKSKEATASLRISSGKGGACLSHSHAQQLGYVREAISLWVEIHENIFDFWETVEHDMVLSGTPYSWRNTGQGFARVSGGPQTYSRMKRAISTTQGRLGGWVGSQVVHLGDDDVPNPLVFIDKYTIIPNLVGPVVQFVEGIDAMFAGSSAETYPGIRKLVLGAANADDPEAIKELVLRDFYRHGFDGSGDDGGACIDGRLTSAWNWCSLLEKKPFYPLFQLTGFNGFDANYN